MVAVIAVVAVVTVVAVVAVVAAVVVIAVVAVVAMAVVASPGTRAQLALKISRSQSGSYLVCRAPVSRYRWRS